MASSAAQLIADWQAAAASGDAARLCGLYAPDAVLVDCSGEVHQGGRAHRWACAHLAEHIPSSDEGRWRRWLEAGDVALAAGLWNFGRPTGLMVLRRDSSAKWRVLIDMLGDSI
jgi:ketosteroid isomerase-like protein